MAPLTSLFTLVASLLVSMHHAFGLDQLVYDGASGELHCDGDPVDNGDICWYKTSDTVGLERSGRLVASYSQNNGLQMAEEYAGRGVLLSLHDGRLHFPVIQLEDEGEYTCSVIQGRNYTFDVSVYVSPGDLLLSAPVMPILMNSLLSASCFVDAIRPEPVEFYWLVGSMRVPGVNSTSVINSTYNVLSITNILNQTAGEAVDGELLTCVLVWVDGVEFHRSLRIHLYEEEEESVPNNELGRIIAGAFIAGFVVIVVLVTIIVVERKKKKQDKEDDLSNNTRSASDNTYNRTPRLPHGRTAAPFTITGTRASRDRGFLLPSDAITNGDHNGAYEEPRQTATDDRNLGGYLEPMSLQVLSQRENQYDNAKGNNARRFSEENIYQEI